MIKRPHFKLPPLGGGPTYSILPTLSQTDRVQKIKEHSEVHRPIVHLSDKIYTLLKISIKKLHMLCTILLDICSNLVSCNVTMSAFHILRRFLVRICLFTSCSPLTCQEILFSFRREQKTTNLFYHQIWTTNL